MTVRAVLAGTVGPMTSSTVCSGSGANVTESRVDRVKSFKVEEHKRKFSVDTQHRDNAKLAVAVRIK